MIPETVGIMSIFLLLVLLALRVPVAISMIVVSFVGISIIVSPNAALAKLGADAFASTKNYTLSVLPLFILMGMFLSNAKFGNELYQLFDVLLGRIRGGMAMATIWASALFAAVSGSAVATASTIASVSVNEMCNYDYDEGLAAGCAAVGGTLGILIPPSSSLVLYGALTEETIGGLLIAGILPGIMLATMLSITVYLLLLKKPELAPAVDRKKQTKLTWGLIKYVWSIPFIFLITMGGIYFGIFTPTEAGAIGAFLALLCAVMLRRLDWQGFVNSLNQTTRITAMTFLILIGGKMFGSFLTLSRIPIYLAKYIENLDVTSFFVVMIIFAIYFILGCLMDAMAILVFMTPIIYPIVISMGFSGIWFGVMSIIMLNTGLLTPPVGVVSLVVASITKVAPLKVFRGVIPFWITLIIGGIIITIFPQIATYLPSLMK
jgi:tripartite ATP-independent transporter DctM subunit